MFFGLPERFDIVVVLILASSTSPFKQGGPSIRDFLRISRSAILLEDVPAGWDVKETEDAINP
jgi:hypothetical protein